MKQTEKRQLNDIKPETRWRDTLHRGVQKITLKEMSQTFFTVREKKSWQYRRYLNFFLSARDDCGGTAPIKILPLIYGRIWGSVLTNDPH